MSRLLLVLGLIVVPLVELYVLIQVGQVVGALPTVLLLVAVSLLGGWLLRREGARCWHTLQGALAHGRAPAREVADGVVVVLAGALLLTPGFVTDVVGLLLLLPPVRALVRARATAYVLRRMVGGVFGAAHRRGHGSTVIDGEVLDP